MNIINLITKTRIVSEKVSDKIIQNCVYSNKITRNTATELFVGKFPNEFYIIFDEAYSVNDENSMFDNDEKAQIPFENAMVADLNFRNKDVAKIVVKTILEVYPELLIVDDDSGEIITADKYIDS